MRQRTAYGFTLLELLVAMAIFGLVLSLAMSAYQHYTTQWQQRAQRTDIHAIQARQLALLHRSVESAFDYYVDTAIDAFQQQPRPLFHTWDGGFRYLTLASISQPGEPALAELRLEPAGQSQQLIYREWPLQQRYLEQSQLDEEDAWQLTLFENIEQARFTYQGYANRQAWLNTQLQEGAPLQTEILQWHDNYQASERELLPQAVRIELTTMDGQHYPLLFLLRAHNPAKTLFLGDEGLN